MCVRVKSGTCQGGTDMGAQMCVNVRGHLHVCVYAGTLVCMFTRGHEKWDVSRGDRHGDTCMYIYAGTCVYMYKSVCALECSQRLDP